MLTASLTRQCLPFWSLASAQEQQRLVADALSYTLGSDLAPSSEERFLLTQFVLGRLTMAQVAEQLLVASAAQ